MKRSTMIKKALNHTLNTVCVNEEQVERMLELFEKLEMLPPKACIEGSVRVGDGERTIYRNVHEWEPENE